MNNKGHMELILDGLDDLEALNQSQIEDTDDLSFEISWGDLFEEEN